MLVKHVNITPIETKKKGFHLKIYYSYSGNVYRVSTGIFLNSIDQRQVKMIKGGALKHNWFHKGDYERLKELIEKYDEGIDGFINKTGRKPSLQELNNQLNPISSNESEIVDDNLENMFLGFIRVKERRLKSQGLNSTKIRKKLERYSTMHKTICYYSNHVINHKIDLHELTTELFWDMFVSFLLYDKPRNLSKGDSDYKHELNESFGKSIFIPKFGISNNTVLKWLGDFNTILNHYKSRPEWVHLISKVKDAIKECLDKLAVKEYHNYNPALRLNEFDVLKSDEFENAIKGGILDDKQITRENLVKIKDTFVAMIIVGSRYNDFIEIEQTDIINQKDIANKTSSAYKLNINDRLICILEKYNYDFKMTNQQFNKRIKVLMKQFYEYILGNKLMAKTDLIVVKDVYRGRYCQRTVYQKHELIGAHTARRSFASIAYYDLNKKHNKEVIMKYTGHKSEREFDKYINLMVDEDASNDMAEGFN